MKNKKNLLCALLLAGLLSASMVGCDGGNNSVDSPINSDTTSDVPNDSTGGGDSTGGDSTGGDEITHKTYEEIEGEPVRVVAPIAEGNVKGYSVKICPCGEELQGDYTVLVAVKLNGAELATQTVKVGAGLSALTLPTRDGYTLKLYKDGKEYALTETFDDFATVELTSRWFYTETDFDYVTDVEARVATLPTEVTAENAEAVLEQIAAIEAIVNTHYTEEEKAGIASLAELKAAAEAIVSTSEYQLNKKLAAIPEIEDMTDETATLFAVLDYIVYYNGVKDELSDYSEPRKISIYKTYFSGKDATITNLPSKIETSATLEGTNLVMSGAEDNTYTFTLPKLPYALFNELSTITVFGMANASYTFNAYETTFANTGNAWNWFKVLKVGAEGKTLGDGTVLEEGYYFTIGNTDVGSEWYTYVKLPDAVVNGEEALTFTVTTSDGAWDYLTFRQDGSVSASNFVGKLDDIQSDVAVRKVTYSYKDGAGDKTITQYYLDGESLELPELNVSYTDGVGTHTFSGWGETADAVTGDLTYTAMYETVYKTYTVIFLDAEYDVFEEKDGYKYGDKVVLPTATPEKAKEGDWKFEFIGWFNGDKEVTSETLVEKNVEIEPRFKAVYDGACYVLTIESAGLETQTYNIPALTDLQAEALSLIPTLERSGYTFAGYMNKETNETVEIANLTLSSDITIVAKWTPNYIAMAAKLPASVEEITNEDQTYSDLIAYLSDVANNPVEGYEEPANVTALKAHYAGTRKIYTFTSTTDGNVTTSARFETVQDKTDAWYRDDQKVLYGGYIQATFDTADGEGWIVLPKINYVLYSEVSFAVYGKGAENAVQVSINGSSATLDNGGGIYYVVEIHGKALELHQMNNSANVLLTVTLTDAQYNGIEGLKIDVVESGWSCVQISHILGQLAVEEAEEPETPDEPEEEVTAETLLAKLPASVAEIENEDQTYSDLVAYLSYVANNPVEGYEEPANVTALKAHYAGTRKIYTYVSAEDLAVTGSLNTSIGTKGDDWYQDDQGVKYDGYYNMVFDKADGDYIVTLTKINYSLYSEVSFGLYVGYPDGAAISVTINGQTCSTLDGYYVVEINGKNLNIHKMNEPENVLLTVTLTDAQYNGTEALTLNITESGWSSIQVSHILGQLAGQESEEPETPDEPEEVKAETLLAKLPASVEEITNEDQTYSDLVAYLSFVANNPVEGYEEPAKVTALKAHYAGTRKIYTYVSAEDLAVTESLNTSIAAKADDWYQDDQGVNYDGYYNMVFDLADGDYIVTLTKINYSLYSEVSFGLYVGYPDGAAISVTINGQTCSTLDGYYVVEINGKNLNIHKMNEPENVLLTATLTDAQYNGTEALTLNVTESGWSNVQISYILGTLA